MIDIRSRMTTRKSDIRRFVSSGSVIPSEVEESLISCIKNLAFADPSCLIIR